MQKMVNNILQLFCDTIWCKCAVNPDLRHIYGINQNKQSRALYERLKKNLRLLKKHPPKHVFGHLFLHIPISHVVKASYQFWKRKEKIIFQWFFLVYILWIFHFWEKISEKPLKKSMKIEKKYCFQNWYEALTTC